MKRYISEKLRQWKNQNNRKPLIIKGVRQTGKTYTLKKFGENEFARVHYINFERNQTAANLFSKDFNPSNILTDLSFLLKSSIDIRNDLLIFDEIQACPAALTSLKYFAEDLPQLAICCAGSLLGLHLGEESFPVGKVEFMQMKPMCFAEFLEANDDQRSLAILNTNQDKLSEVIHAHLWEQFKIYLVTGGLPEVVQTFIDSKNDLHFAFQQTRKKQSDLLLGYYADIAKHSGKINAMHIDRVWRAIPSQLAKTQDGSATRFQFKGILPGIDRYQRLANVIDWLLAAELIIKVPIVEHVELPLMAYVKEHHFKLYLFDVGILGALADLAPETILHYEYGTYKGYVAENFIAQELIAKNHMNLYSWQSNRSEIEFLYPIADKIIPIEVKSGHITRSQSLNKFSEKYHPPYKVTFSGRPLLIDEKNHYRHYPLYMAYWFP